MDTKTITMMKSTVCGGVSVKPGDVVEASVRDAFFLISTKAAVEGGEVKKKGGKKAPTNRMVDEDELMNRDSGE
jgi:hypothetical protein